MPLPAILAAAQAAAALLARQAAARVAAAALLARQTAARVATSPITQRVAQVAPALRVLAPATVAPIVLGGSGGDEEDDVGMMVRAPLATPIPVPTTPLVEPIPMLSRGPGGTAVASPVTPIPVPTPIGIPTPTLTGGESIALAKQYGLQGMGFDKAFVGLSPAEANRRANEEKNKRLAQQSALTAGVFNPQTIAGVKKTMGGFQARLDEITNQPWNKPDKARDTKDLVDLFSSDIAKNFTSYQDFQVAQQSPDFINTIDSYIKAGGTLSEINAKIQTRVAGIQEATDPVSFIDRQNQLQAKIIKQVPNNDGTITHTMDDGTSVTTDQAGNPISAADQAVRDALDPETDIGQKEIARQTGMAKDVADFYFGTPEKIGFLAQEKALNEAKSKAAAERLADDKTSSRDKAQYTIDKNTSDIAVAEAENETNRLNSKNYMTGWLAKMGALITTGTAPLALATLEEKYQTNSRNLKLKLSFANREIEMNLKDKINELENDFADKEITLSEDLSKSQKEAMKEITKAQQAADRAIYDITSASAKLFRTEKDKYQKEVESNNVRYAVQYLKLAGDKFTHSMITQVLSASGIIDVSKLTPEMMRLLGPKETGEDADLATSLNRVLTDPASLSEMTPTLQNKIRNKLFNMGINNTNPTKWFTESLEESAQSSLLPSVVKTEWDKFKKALVTPAAIPGALSPANITKGINFILTSEDSEDGDLERFEEDREFQTWVMSQAGGIQ